MAKPDEIAAYTDKKTHRTETIAALDKLFIVCYNRLPIQVRTGHLVSDTTRVQRTVFESQRTAERTAARLNTRYKTTSFTVEVFGGDATRLDKLNLL